MFGIGMQELVVVFLIALLIFGASKLPEIGKGLGKAIKEFKKAGKEIKHDLEDTSEIQDQDENNK